MLNQNFHRYTPVYMEDSYNSYGDPEPTPEPEEDFSEE